MFLAVPRASHLATRYCVGVDVYVLWCLPLVFPRCIQLRQQRLAMKQTLEKEETNRWIEKDKQSRLLSERRQQEELARERQEIDAWKASSSSASAGTQGDVSATQPRGSTEIDASARAVINEDVDTDDDTDDDNDDGTESTAAGKASCVHRDEVEDNDEVCESRDDIQLRHVDDRLHDVVKDVDDGPLPPPRQQQRATITFTQLETDHMPARATREVELKEWKLANNVPRRTGTRADEDGRKGGDDGDDDLSTRHPMFIKDKADEFFKHGDYHAAERMYSRCLKIDSEFMPAVNNRSCCNLMLGRYTECESDCTHAISILNTSRESDIGGGGTILREKLAKLLKRRGIARAHRAAAATATAAAASSAPGVPAKDDGAALEALADLKAALATLKDDDDLAHNIAELEMAIEANRNVGAEGGAGSSSDGVAADQMYSVGAKRMTSGDLEGAELAFTTALDVLERTGDDGARAGGSGDASASTRRHFLRARCLANRSSIHLQLGRYYDCTDDADALGREIEHLKRIARSGCVSEHESLLVVRLEAMANSRRGLAQFGLRSYLEAIESLEASKSLYVGIGDDDEASKIDEDIRDIEHRLDTEHV